MTNDSVHEAAAIFPLDEEHLEELVKDIRRRGLLVPIETVGGKIIDGRRRWLACQRAGVEPEMVEVETNDPVGYVVSLNLYRRHLTVSQAAMCAQRARAMYDRAAKQRQRQSGGRGVRKGVAKCPQPKGKARDQVGDVFGISGKTVDRAQRVIQEGIPELAQAVDAGTLTVNRAATIASWPKKLQKEIFEAGKANSKGKNSPKAKPKKHEEELPPGTPRGVGLLRAQEAINCLIRIPKNDRLRKLPGRKGLDQG